jgi:hypothetical protein
MGYPAYVVRIHSLGGGASLAAAALGYAEGKVAAGGHSFLWRAGYGYVPTATKYVWRVKQKDSVESNTRKAIWFLRWSIGDDPREE